MGERPTELARRAGPCLGLGAAGGLAFWSLGFPAPWLCGPMVATALWALSGRPIEMPVQLRDAGFLVLGVSIGSGLTLAALQGVGRWPLSILALLLSLPLIVGAVQLYLQRGAGWARRDAFLAAVPGVLSYVVAMAIDRGADVRRVATAQSVRLFLLILLLPLALGSRAAPMPAPEAEDAGLAGIAGLCLAGLVAGWLLGRARLPAAYLFGGLAASGLAHLTGLVATALPQAVVIPALLIVGSNAGARFAGTDLATLRAILASSVVAFAIGMALAASVALAVSLLLDLAFAQTLLAFAPGGLDAMVVMAFALGLEPTYVASHQLLRFLCIAVGLPAAFAAFERYAPKQRPVEKRGE